MTGRVVEALDSLLHKAHLGGGPEERAPAAPAEGGGPTVAPKTHATAHMVAVQWAGKKSVQVKQMPRPAITDPTDVLLRVTHTCICGSDLHLYLRGVPGMKSGDVLGHEFMGVVEEVGDEVEEIKRGDRVVVAFDISCGRCFFCSRGLQSSCSSTNPSKVQEWMYGQATAGMYGYSHLTGGYQGGQAEYVRVPLADHNCLVVPEGVPALDAVLLSDVLPTAWHACEMGEVGPGDVVAVLGAGPVGLLAAHCAQHRGARRVILVDNVGYRLGHARSKLPGVEVVNFAEENTLEALRELTAEEPGGGPDVVIEAVGLHYTKSWLHAVEMALQVETDTSEILNEAIYAVRKGGRVSVVGVHAGYTNHFAIGAFMEKQLTMRGGQTPVQRYWRDLLRKVEAGELTPSLAVTHVLPLAEAPRAFEMFNSKTDGCVKVVMRPGGEAKEAEREPAGASAGGSGGGGDAAAE